MLQGRARPRRGRWWQFPWFQGTKNAISCCISGRQRRFVRLVICCGGSGVTIGLVSFYVLFQNGRQIVNDQRLPHALDQVMLRNFLHIGPAKAKECRRSYTRAGNAVVQKEVIVGKHAQIFHVKHVPGIHRRALGDKFAVLTVDS